MAESDHPQRLSMSETKRLIVAYAWSLDRSFSDAELEIVSEWANDPATPRELVDRVLDGGMSIRREGGKFSFKPRRNMEAKEVRKALDRLNELQADDVASINPSNTISLIHRFSDIPDDEREAALEKVLIVMRHLKWDDAYIQAFAETGVTVNQVNENSIPESDVEAFREAMTRAVARGIGGEWGGRLPSFTEVETFSNTLQNIMELYNFDPLDGDGPNGQPATVSTFAAGPSSKIEGSIEVTARCGGLSIERASFTKPEEAVAWIVERGMPMDAAEAFIKAVPTCEKGSMLTFNTRNYPEWKAKRDHRADD